MTTEARPRRPASPTMAPPIERPEPAPAETARETPRSKPVEKRPYLLDFFPLETADQTRLHRFYERLREGKLSTTRCTRDNELHWPPRTACPKCRSEELEWVDLPERGHVFAFSAVLAGAPLGMEHEVPFAVGLVDLDGVPLRVFGRIEGLPWNQLRIGQPVRTEAYDIGDGRMFYRFRTTD
ncbi:MAG TPA: OB-fold domain-containing protein [Thermoplasmata archaeon]|nr:OB-fold domain-containing protein [Thermoplasmata archaeon]